jgi:hypothetical protein
MLDGLPSPALRGSAQHGAFFGVITRRAAERASGAPPLGGCSRESHYPGFDKARTARSRRRRGRLSRYRNSWTRPSRVLHRGVLGGRGLRWSPSRQRRSRSRDARFLRGEALGNGRRPVRNHRPENPDEHEMTSAHRQSRISDGIAASESLDLRRNTSCSAGTTMSSISGPISMPPTTTVASGRCT